MEDILATVKKKRRKMAGHILRRQREKPARTAIYIVVARRRQKEEGEAEEDLEEMGVSWHGAYRIASDRNRWRLVIARCSERNRRT